VKFQIELSHQSIIKLKEARNQHQEEIFTTHKKKE